METIMSILQALQLNAMEVFAVAVLFLGAGYWRGARKAAILQTRIYKLENDILELHAEILYPKDETPVIEIGNSSDKKKNVAN
jgi:hypothetical protein